MSSSYSSIEPVPPPTPYPYSYVDDVADCVEPKIFSLPIKLPSGRQLVWQCSEVLKPVKTKAELQRKIYAAWRFASFSRVVRIYSPSFSKQQTPGCRRKLI